MRLLPPLIGILVALLALVTLGPALVAGLVLRSSSGSEGPGLLALLLIAAFLIALVAAAGFAAAWLARFLLRLTDCR